MYEVLVNALRWCVDESICCDDFSGEKCPYWDVRKDSCSVDDIMHDAADAIEALMKENKQLKKDKEYDEWLHNDRPCPDFAREE